MIRCLILRGFAALALALSATASPAQAEDAIASAALDCRVRAADVRVIETTLAGVPALLRVPAKTVRSPIVLWHGFGPPAGERALMQALPLDEVAAIKVYLGLPLFGRRLEGGNTDALVRRQTADVGLQVFEPVVLGAARELPAVLDALRESGCLGRGERIGLFGFSAGGAAVLYALAEHAVAVDRAIVLNASIGLDDSVAAWQRATGRRYAWSDAARRIARASDAIARAGDIARGDAPPALLIVQGTADAMLTPQPAIDLHAALVPHYAGSHAQRLRLILADGMGHDPTVEPGLADLRRLSAQWFASGRIAAADAPREDAAAAR